MRRESICLLTLMIGAAASPASAQAGKISILPGDNPKVIAYTPCEPTEEAGECISHLLSCETDESYGSGLELTVVGQGEGPGGKPDIPAMASKLIEGRYGDAKLRFTVGGNPAEVTTHYVMVTSNELNGDWDLTVRTMDPGGLLDVLTPESSAKVTADMGGYEVQLAASATDGEALMKFKKACTE